MKEKPLKILAGERIAVNISRALEGVNYSETAVGQRLSCRDWCSGNVRCRSGRTAKPEPGTEPTNTTVASLGGDGLPILRQLRHLLAGAGVS
jgi:hypothetical protein